VPVPRYPSPSLADVIRRYYDQPDLDAEPRRRITAFDEINICEHSDPTDIDEELSE
jgi:hypothetical protein